MESQSETPAQDVNTTDILGTDTMAEAGRKIFARQLHKMLQHEEGSRTGDDIESVHDMRVAIRRMRSLFRLLGEYYTPKVARKYSKALRKIARVLGQIRDLDVLILDLQAFRSMQPKTDQVIVDSLIQKLDKQRRKNRIMVNALFDSAFYKQFVRQFKSFTQKQGKGALPIDSLELPHQVRHVLPILLHQRLARVRAYDVVLTDADDETLHALRVEYKRLRYAVEFFEPILGGSTTNFVKEIKSMQDLLGCMNDITVFVERVGAIKRLSEEQQGVINHYRDVREQELATLREEFDSVWQSFNSRTTLKQFADALLVLR